ncbi:MAG: OPT/YSL family transporter, partial [Actinomycetota bacterium]
GMVLYTSINSPVVPNGYYFYNPQSGKFEIQWIQGIGSARAAAPQAQLMATVINGILQRRLPWGLILLGVFLVIAVELLGVRSLSFAVGFYLSIATTLAIFAGGVVRWLVEYSAKRAGEKVEESEVSPGALYSSGLIAAGGIVGLAGMVIKVMEAKRWLPENSIAWGPRLIPSLANSNILSVIMFGLLGYSLYYFARKPLQGEK